VRGWLDAAAIVLEVTNPTVDASLRRPSARGHGMALDNIQQRLELAFPGRSAVTLEDAANRYSVRLRFPLVTDEAPVAWSPAAATHLAS
jgi:two-component system, LytTR family, sensor histidine kinase AlgZ